MSDVYVSEDGTQKLKSRPKDKAAIYGWKRYSDGHRYPVVWDFMSQKWLCARDLVELGREDDSISLRIMDDPKYGMPYNHGMHWDPPRD